MDEKTNLPALIVIEGYKMEEENLLMNTNFSLRKIAKKCNSSFSTAKRWWNRRDEFEETGKLLRKKVNKLKIGAWITQVWREMIKWTTCSSSILQRKSPWNYQLSRRSATGSSCWARCEEIEVHLKNHLQAYTQELWLEISTSQGPELRCKKNWWEGISKKMEGISKKLEGISRKICISFFEMPNGKMQISLERD